MVEGVKLCRIKNLFNSLILLKGSSSDAPESVVISLKNENDKIISRV